MLKSEDKAIRMVVDIISDTITYEFNSTQDIQETCSSVFKVYYQLNHEKNQDKQGELIALKFNNAF
jgi:hypothetical protein